mmetsp:Transcript_21842/g.36152  ORF Transcript_21842/g.36152 Transcript_21842/m.36152 type:complete len:357 (-) Transcript_21842:774-1844(-)|eukprot:CAMPEP_0184334096 /NCGR_PEP_ID=MMETSP1089-20130417/3006_1 /TAXON_ID=38269 ORGANISM="Gloeochaete wittrockiana, Strain SAG46.84" /NCGR_SAMPLE_ID=MMETSP1089 /ASSEMBLY_ACC=CAM_ASM_000445 /LENGTH=356 /DNA_ID=CAMNT_0026658257 /DNA_START=68 /DNA_END=1138 /DNA_ORIENTATION=+
MSISTGISPAISTALLITELKRRVDDDFVNYKALEDAKRKLERDVFELRAQLQQEQAKNKELFAQLTDARQRLASAGVAFPPAGVAAPRPPATSSSPTALSSALTPLTQHKAQAVFDKAASGLKETFGKIGHAFSGAGGVPIAHPINPPPSSHSHSGSFSIPTPHSPFTQAPPSPSPSAMLMSAFPASSTSAPLTPSRAATNRMLSSASDSFDAFSLSGASAAPIPSPRPAPSSSSHGDLFAFDNSRASPIQTPAMPPQSSSATVDLFESLTANSSASANSNAPQIPASASTDLFGTFDTGPSDSTTRTTAMLKIGSSSAFSVSVSATEHMPHGVLLSSPDDDLVNSFGSLGKKPS